MTSEAQFRSRRSEVYAREGMVATSQPLAAQAGLWILRRGGSAFDAAVGTAAALCVVEPMSTGLGGDAFVLLRTSEGEIGALNGSGRLPAAADPQAYAERGSIPRTGMLPVTVPGAVDAWITLLQERGRLPVEEILLPAIHYARNGFPVSPVVALYWERLAPKLREFEETRRVFLPGDRPPRAGEIFQQHELAGSLELLAAGGRAAFYEGEIAARLLAHSRELGGFLSEEDLAAHHSEWVEPISTRYRMLEVYECPPNGQGLIVLLALNLLSGLELPPWGTAEHLHLVIEALKLAFADGEAVIADPEHAQVPLEELLDPAYAQERRQQIRPGRALGQARPGPVVPAGRDTAYLCTADAEGNCCSFIQSLYEGFGSGVTVPGTGMVLQNRGAGFSLDPEHPNRLEGGKRPFHTIIPGLAVEPGRRVIPFGVMGGPMQPQGHVLVISNREDYGLGVQEALDRPRLRLAGEGQVLLEEGHDAGVMEQLAAWGHDVRWEDRLLGGFGGGQMIELDLESKVLCGGSEPRKDGLALGY